ncbi:MAG: ABC transporter ATP-binding protein [Actinobacteria bacterium]|nr:ABC transporter ATP-binding protein [Actinomycetota bacterium]
MQSILKASNLSKKYGQVSALDGIELSIAAGEWVSIMGPSGSGKSTLLNIICGLDSPTSGSVTVDGMELAGLSEAQLARYRREMVGLVFQQFHLIPYLSAFENVMLSQYFHSMPDADEAREALELVGMAHRLDHLPSQLSGGEQQRVCIARALINEPKILLADEPTGNLDEKNEIAVMQLLKELYEQGMTLAVVTHDPSVGEAGDRIIRLEHGRIHEENHGPRSSVSVDAG